MLLSRLFPRRSLRSKLILHYGVILAIGGMVTSVVGSYIVTSALEAQVRKAVDKRFVTTRTVYEEFLRRLQLTVELTASGTTIPDYLARKDDAALLKYLSRIRREGGFDFLTLASREGRVILRASRPEASGDDVSNVPLLASALDGKSLASTEIVSLSFLAREDPRLAEQARMKVIPTPRAKPTAKTELDSGMVMLAATPVLDPGGRTLGVLYGGVLLNQNFAIVDRVWELLFRGEQLNGEEVGAVTIFQDDVRISTNVRNAAGDRALGTLLAAEVYDTVVGVGQPWLGRSFVVKDWFISRYEPIRDSSGKAIGALFVGILERSYAATRDRVVISFLAIATIGFFMIIAITYYEIHQITKPVAQMVEATRNIAAGRFDQEVEVAPGDQGEIALLAESFNMMLKSLRTMKADLEEWGRTLEQKVRERTDELVAMQARVSQSERLASLGMLAAGVAHEINNPLGGILALTSLTLEDMKPDDPNRENLEEVVHQTQRCRDIVKGLLEFSRQSRMGADLVDINKVLDDTLALITRQAAFFNVSIVKAYDPELPAVMANKSELQQVFMNILVNAAQAIENHGTITIKTRTSADREAVEIQISDTGHGIPPEHIGRIFDPFFSTKPSGQGTGLGLSIAYGIITSHRGTINVDSEVGKGTTFTIRLPIATGSAQVSEE